MSIIDKTGQTDTITEGWRALELFTDRHEAIRLFSEYLNDDPPRERILFYHGGGGNGKSLLLRYLREHFCKHLSRENWEYIKNLQDDEFIEHILKAEGAESVPSALLDFGMPPRGDDRPQEAFSALLMLRRDLAGHNLRFPLFDFACVWYLYRTSKLTKENLGSLFPAEEMDFITEIVNAVSDTSWATLGKVVFGIFGKHLGKKLTLYLQQRKLDETQVNEIQRMDPQSELIDQLPQMFARDLNAVMSFDSAPSRIALFFDTHEAFWGYQRTLPDEIFFQRDEWLRRLLGTLELSAGIVAVVAGRDMPRWAEASKVKISNEYLDTQLVGHLLETDAMQYLERAGIANARMRRALVDYAQVATNQIHPLYLGLCADVVLAAAEKGKTLTPEDFRIEPKVADKEKELIDRLLRYVDSEIGSAVRTLSACRAFDRATYFTLGKALRFQTTETAFNSLTRFSFVWRAERRGEGWYRIHDLLRRLFRERGEDKTIRADEVLEKHYRELGKTGEITAIAEATYHTNQLDWERGVNEWINLFDEALNLSRYEICNSLLEVRGELSLGTYFAHGRISQCEGDYFTNLARHHEAEQEYLEAISAYDEALNRAPDDVYAHNNKGNTLQRLGDLQAGLSQHQEALDSYNKSISAYDEALNRAPDDVPAHNNKGSALQRLGDLQAGLSQHQEALDSYNKSISAFDEALNRAPDYVSAHNNKGLALQRLGKLQAGFSQRQEAIKSFQAALAEFSCSLEIAPNDKFIHNLKDQVKKMINQLRRL